MEYHCIALSQPGPTKKRNEDALLLNGQMHQGSIRLEQTINANAGEPMVFAVADGMAGSPHPHVGSALLLLLLHESFKKSADTSISLRERLLALQDLYVEHSQKRKCHGTAATLAGIVITDRLVQVFNVGDSRVYGIKNGIIRQLSKDHTELADMIESGEIASMPVKDAPSSFLEPSSFYMADTMHSLARVYVRNVRLDEVDSILICSDGLIDVLDDDEIGKAAQAGIDSLHAAISKARKRKGFDDITLCLVQPGNTIS